MRGLSIRWKDDRIPRNGAVKQAQTWKIQVYGIRLENNISGNPWIHHRLLHKNFQHDPPTFKNIFIMVLESFSCRNTVFMHYGKCDRRTFALCKKWCKAKLYLPEKWMQKLTKHVSQAHVTCIVLVSSHVWTQKCLVEQTSFVLRQVLCVWSLVSSPDRHHTVLKNESNQKKPNRKQAGTKTEAVHCGAFWTRTLSQVGACVKHVPKQSIAEHFEHERYHRFGHV